MKHTDLAVDYFERHSTSQECHITSDSRVFHTSGHAISFASAHDLQDQTVESYTRAQVELEKELPFTTEIDTSDVDDSLEVINEVLQKSDGTDTEVEAKEVADLETENIEDETDLSGFESPAGQIALDVFLANNDVEKIEYKDLKALVKHFNIETADQKADTLKTALTEFKNNLAQ